MRKSFKDSLKALEADIQHANTLASDYPREYDGACLQMRLSYSPCAHIFLFLVQWADCHLAGLLGLIRILIYKAYEDGKTTMCIHERKASLKEFYGVIFPSLLQLHKGITDVEERKQREVCATKYRRKDEMAKGKLMEIEIEREEECGICMEMNTKVVLPGCSHSLCMNCYRNWYVYTSFTAGSKLYRFVTPQHSTVSKACCFAFIKQMPCSDLSIHHISGSDCKSEFSLYIALNGRSYGKSIFCRQSRSQSCPFCRDSLKRMNSRELWIYTSKCDVVDLSAIAKEDLKRLFMYINRLPLVIPDRMLVAYDPR